MSHKFSTALRYVGTGADFVVQRKGSSLESVDSASCVKITRHDPDASTRPPFARDEFYEKCGLFGVSFGPRKPDSVIPKTGWASIHLTSTLVSRQAGCDTPGTIGRTTPSPTLSCTELGLSRRPDYSGAR